MVLGHGHCISTLLLSEREESAPVGNCNADHHRAQFLGADSQYTRYQVTLRPWLSPRTD